MKYFIFLILLGFAYPSEAQTLFSFGNHEVSSNEFLRAYNRNKTSGETSTAIRDYLQLYVNYKLKVQDAIDHRLDTLPSLKADLQNFRHQMEAGYQYDKPEFDRLIDEALDRGKKDIHVRTIVITMAQELDSVDFRNLAEQIRDASIRNDKKEIKLLADNKAEVLDQDMGFISVFTLPYNIENIVYSLKTGEFSQPVLINNRYWIFANDGERPATGKIRIAQILITPPPGDSAGEVRSGELADSIYRILQHGGDFATLAREFSNDRNTYLNGGEMPEMTVGKYSPDFERHAFALKNAGDLSAPFRTSFGFHILKLVSADPVALQQSDERKAEVTMKVLQDNRVHLAEESMIRKAGEKTGVRTLGFSKEDLYNITDSFLLDGRNSVPGGMAENTPLLAFNDDSEVAAGDWLRFARNNVRMSGGDRHSLYEQQWKEFKNSKVMTNFRRRLPEFDSDFTAQLTDFNEGNMLFEMMQQNVWSKAENDSSGLRNYYDRHAGKYKWDKSVDAIIFYCSSPDIALQVIEELNQGKLWKEIQNDADGAVQADSGRFELSRLSLPDSVIREQTNTPVVTQFDNSASFVRILKIYPADQHRNFEDARGLVIDDYQTQLEEEWISRLKKMYPVKINQQIWKSILSDN